MMGMLLALSLVAIPKSWWVDDGSNMTREFLGTGWKFPISLNLRGGIRFSSAESDIQEAIWIILSTAPGERQMLPQFGCGIHNFVFAPNSPATRASIAHQVFEALNRWEPRIDVLDLQVDSISSEENTLLIRINYRIRANNAFHNLVYPFYIREERGE
jgi:phage baseplate assembly protein W